MAVFLLIRKNFMKISFFQININNAKANIYLQFCFTIYIYKFFLR